jgi:hypothetical protein
LPAARSPWTRYHVQPASQRTAPSITSPYLPRPRCRGQQPDRTRPIAHWHTLSPSCTRAAATGGRPARRSKQQPRRRDRLRRHPPARPRRSGVAPSVCTRSLRSSRWRRSRPERSTPRAGPLDPSQR